MRIGTRVMAAIALAAVGFGLTGCNDAIKANTNSMVEGVEDLFGMGSSKNTNTSQVALVDMDAEARKLEQRYNGRVRSGTAVNYVQSAGRDMEALCGSVGKCEFIVLNSDEFQHYGLPIRDKHGTVTGHRVYVTKGLLRYLENGAQLRSVLAMEIELAKAGHIANAVEQHEDDYRARQAKAKLGSAIIKGTVGEAPEVAAIVGLAAIGIIGADGTFGHEYSEQETMAADSSASAALLRSDWDSRQYVRLLEKYQDYSATGSVASFRTHKVTDMRVEAVRSQTTDEAFTAKTDSDAYKGKVLAQL